MDVLLTPPYSRNPYMELLCEALRARGLKVACAPIRLQRNMPAVIHVHWERYWIHRPRIRATVRATTGLLLALAWARLRGSRIIWTVHNLRDHDAGRPGLERCVQLALSRLAHALVVHHPKAVQTLRQHLWLGDTKAVVVMPKGPMPVASDETQAQARAALGLPADALVIAALGALRPYKRIPLLLEAMQHCKRPDLHVLVGGWPGKAVDTRPWVAQARKDPRIHLDCRHLHDAELAQRLLAADAMIILTEGHFSSGAATLGVSAGRAIIGARSDHITFLCGPGGHLPLDTRSAQSLGRALAGLDREQLGKASAANRQQAANMRWDDAAAALIDAYATPD